MSLDQHPNISPTENPNDNLSEKLHASFGFPAFRDGQEQCVRQLLDGHSSLAIFPTGSGKSLCYQFTALQLPALTLVVSPLLALIQDQLDFLQAKGIPAASIDSTLTPAQYQQVVGDVRSGQTKILMVSVERFKNERFRQFIEQIPLSMLVIDEAHCISEWGHNFRPDYLKLPQYSQQLNIPLVLLLTATATKKVKLDMAAKFAIAPEHIVQTGFYRPNLHLDIVPVSSEQRNAELLEQIQAQNGAGSTQAGSNQAGSTQAGSFQAGIVYVTLQQTAVDVATYLKRQGIDAQAYHAGFPSEERQQIQQRFMQGQLAVVVATIAFGMGVDKSDIRFVVHYDLPKSIENYSQEIGRAGRDGAPAHCITLANLDGLSTVENFVYGDTPEPSGIQIVLDSIRQETQAQTDATGQWELQANSLATASNIRLLALKTLLVQLELRQVLVPKYAYFAEYKFRLMRTQAELLQQFSGERLAFLTALFATAQIKKVWGEVNFEALQQQYPSDRQRVISALDYLQEQNLIELQTRKMTDVYQVNNAALNQPDLVESLSDYFKTNEQKEIARIAALIRFFQLDRCLNNNLARYFDDQNVPERCGHCSVCAQRVALLQRYQPEYWPSDEQLHSYLSGFNAYLQKQAGSAGLPVALSSTLQCRFLTGVTVPLFTRFRVRASVPGFAACQSLRYAEVLAKVELLTANQTQ
jgi:ATP-dependent DNA helicase RecQ